MLFQSNCTLLHYPNSKQVKPQANSSLAGPQSHLKPIRWHRSPFLHLKLGSTVTNKMNRDRELKEQELPWPFLFYQVGKSAEFCSVWYFLTSGRVRLVVEEAQNTHTQPPWWLRCLDFHQNIGTGGLWERSQSWGWSLSALAWPELLRSHQDPGHGSWSA